MSKRGNIVVRKNTGAEIAARRRLDVVEGAGMTIGVVDNPAGDEVTLTFASGAVGGTILANRNGGAAVGPRPELSFNEGANITIAVVDDPANNEIDITIASAGAGGGAWLKEFYPAVNPDNRIGPYSSVMLTNNVLSTLYQTFMIPDDIFTITTAVVIVVPEGTGNIYRSVTTNFGTPCIGEVYNVHSDALALAAVGIVLNQLDCIDISGALTGATGGDLVGMEFVRDATNALDTVDANVHYIGVYIEGTVEQE